MLAALGNVASRKFVLLALGAGLALGGQAAWEASGADVSANLGSTATTHSNAEAMLVSRAQLAPIVAPASFAALVLATDGAAEAGAGAEATFAPPMTLIDANSGQIRQSN